jgi:hypothetical protein
VGTWLLLEGVRGVCVMYRPGGTWPATPLVTSQSGPHATGRLTAPCISSCYCCLGAEHVSHLCRAEHTALLLR